MRLSRDDERDGEPRSRSWRRAPWPRLVGGDAGDDAGLRVRFEVVRQAREAVQLGLLETPACVSAAAERLADALAERRAVEAWALGPRCPRSH